MDRNTRRTSSDIQTVVNSPTEPAPSTRTIVCKPTDYMVGVQFVNHSSARRTAKLVSYGLEPIWPRDAQWAKHIWSYESTWIRRPARNRPGRQNFTIDPVRPATCLVDHAWSGDAFGTSLRSLRRR
uniref:Uncharacterized protein n=1 Tax=Caenorhabditis japonica TaxID=281687 RepID=A0A8R1EDY7_CAEJA